MTDLREHPEHATEIAPNRPRELAIERENLQARTPADDARAQQSLSAVGAEDDSEWRKEFDKRDRLRIEPILGGLRGWISKILIPCWRPLFFLLRAFRVVRFPFTSTYFVTRFDDVQEVLGRDDAFRTPFRAKAARLHWHPPFLLDLQYGPEYRGVKQDVGEHFSAVGLREIVKRKDLEYVKDRSLCHATEILDRKIGGQKTADIEVIRELVCRVPTLVCREYYGITPLKRRGGESEDDHEARLRQFEDSFIAISAYMFGDADEPGMNDPIDGKTDAARWGATIIRKAIREAIVEAWTDRINGTERDDVLSRMIRDNTTDPLTGTKRRFDDARMTSYLFAMMLGFIPTNLMANGNMLEILFDRPWEDLDRTLNAARSGDDDLLRRCLFEAMRFRPLNPGPWRRANADFLLGADAKRPRQLKKGRVVWPCTQSAMFDSRRVKKPGRFDADRSPYVYMVYGFGLHRCIGKPIADVQITQTMKALLSRGNVRVVRRLERMSMFPRSMTLRFDGAKQP